jgi:cardiolipin synthase
MEILQDAQEKYPRLLTDLSTATGSIHMVYYEWAADPFTEEVAEILIDRVKAGVEVRSDLPGVPIQVVSAGPDSEWKAIRHSYLAMLSLARHHVYLQSPFLILDDSLAEAMKTAALAGIDVRVMIAPRGGEISPAYRAGMTYAVDMARAGVKVLLYQGAYFHAQTLSVDSMVCSIGSANIDIRSFAINYETNLVIYDERLTRELEADFEADCERCEPFSERDYKRRAVPSRLADSVMRLCSPLL